jgi:predicted transcriptional regulator
MTSATAGDVVEVQDYGGRHPQPNLAAEVRALAARVAKVFSSDPPPPVTDARLREVEDLHKAVSALNDAARRGRNAVFHQAIAQRWTYERIAQATGLSTARIGQLAPARPPKATAVTDARPPRQLASASSADSDSSS